MLVHVMYGKTRGEASVKGEMHFAAMPQIQDLVEVDNKLCSVLMSWHTPSLFYAGAKAGILVHEDVHAFVGERSRIKDGVEV